MDARISIVEFKPGTAEEATSIFRDIMLPGASVQQGFQRALMFRSNTHPEKHVVISLWETEADMIASHPPEDVLPLLEPLEHLIADISQGSYELLFQVDSPT